MTTLCSVCAAQQPREAAPFEEIVCEVSSLSFKQDHAVAVAEEFTLGEGSEGARLASTGGCSAAAPARGGPLPSTPARTSSTTTCIAGTQQSFGIAATSQTYTVPPGGRGEWRCRHFDRGRNRVAADLLRSHLRLSKAYIEDKDLENDPLTMAEIASQRSGAAFIQATLRDLTALRQGRIVRFGRADELSRED